MIQGDFDRHAAEEHPNRIMTVEVFDADEVPADVLPEGAEATSTDEIVELARAIVAQRQQA